MESSRRPAVSCAALLLAMILAVSLPAAVGVVGTAGAASESPNPCVGTTTEQPAESTLVSIQGAQVTPDGYLKRPALLVSYGPDGSFEWARNASANGRWWAYDVDPLPDGNLLFATTEPGISIVGELDPETNDYVWTERFDGAPDDESNPRVGDAHDIDLIHGDELVAADKGEGHERLLVYNRTRDEVTWEWRFEDHPDQFPESGGGPPADWTHVNDVDTINVSETDAVDAEGEWFVTSVRNFDQVAFVNRSSGDVELTLGEDGDHGTLHRQHNPDHLWGPDGEHTLLVADSRNDRVVEYAYDDATDSWDRVWAVTGLSEPRDADRLPNGNTLVADRMGHRVVEVTPDGEVVWEVYTPYEPYDVERGEPGSDGPTMREHGASGTHEAHGDAGFTDEEIAACGDALFSFAPSQFDAVVGDVTGREVHRGESVPVVPVVGAGLALMVAVGAIAYRFRVR